MKNTMKYWRNISLDAIQPGTLTPDAAQEIAGLLNCAAYSEQTSDGRLVWYAVAMGGTTRIEIPQNFWFKVSQLLNK